MPELTEHHISPLAGDISSSECSDSDLPELESDEDTSIVFPPFELSEADREQGSHCMAMSTRNWIHNSGVCEILSVPGPVAGYVDGFVWHQGMTHGGADQGMLTYPSDKNTVALESNSSDLEELDRTQG